MPACLIRSLGFAALTAASLKMEVDDLLLPQSTTPLLRRTLSADMSSEKWVSDSSMKKVASAENLHDMDDREAFKEISKEEEMEERPKQTDIWSSILSQKAIEEEGKQGSDPPPYVHPLVKRSASTLSEKSLEICTESLGSETGSDGFSSYTPCEVDPEHEEVKDIADVDLEEEPIAKEIAEPLQQEDEEEVRVSAIRCVSAIKKGAFVAARPFPPPLPSLAHRGDGSNVQMRSHREDGRLVLEAVSVPTHACLRSERQDGRLLLSFSGSDTSESVPADADPEEEDDDEDEEEEEVVLYDECDRQRDDLMEKYEEDQENDSDEDEEEEEGEEEYISLGGYGGGVGHKFLDLTRNNGTPPWPRRLNKVVTTLDDDEEEEEDDDDDYMGQSLMNPYVYSWRSKAGPAVVAVAAQGKKQHEEERGINKLLQVDRHYGRSAVVEVVVDAKRAGKGGGGGEDLVPLFLKGCNLQQQQQQPAKKSLLMWGPCCIAA